MRIAVACDTYYPNINGAATFAAQLASRLAARGHEVSIIAPSSGNEGLDAEPSEIPVYRIPSIPLPIPSRFRIARPLLANKDVEVAMRRLKPDLIHVQGHFFLCQAAIRWAKSMKIPVVGTNHVMPENIVHYLKLPAALEPSAVRLGWAQFKRVFRSVDAVTTPTLAAAELLKSIGFSHPVRAVSNGIDLERFTPGNSGRRIRERFNLPPNSTVFLSVSRLDPEKRLDTAIEAFAKAKQRGTGARLVLAGKGQEEPRLRQLAERLNVAGETVLTGFIADEDLPQMYAAADVFLAPGCAELQSIVTMEAMATGVPVIAANALALPELIHDGYNGLLFEPGNAAQFASHISRLAEDVATRKRMGNAARSHVRQHGINSVVDQFEEIYREVAPATANASQI